jgi:hypothetical protein
MTAWKLPRGGCPRAACARRHHLGPGPRHPDNRLGTSRRPVTTARGSSVRSSELQPSPPAPGIVKLDAYVQNPAAKRSLRSVRDFARKEWPLRGGTTSRSAIADRRHLSCGTPAGGHALWSQTRRGSATATVLIRSPYSCWLQRREWAPHSPQWTRHLRPLPGTSASLHPPVPGHPHFDNPLSIGDVQAPRR